jgi:phosphoglycolate phosphatase
MAAIIFDLDGTLIDTAPDLIDTLNVILARESLRPVNMDEARPMIGAGAKRLLERALAAHGIAFEAELLERLYADYIEHYSAHIADRSRPFEGLVPALDALAAQGHCFAVCTNKLEWLSVRLLEALDLRQRFVAICGQDTFGVAKPDPEVLRKTIAAAGGDVGRAIMVGDSATDIDTARAAGVPVIAVDFGYSDKPIAEFSPDRIISRFEALPAAVDALRARIW